MYDDALKKRFDFDEADLELNRNGSLSARQVARLQKEARAWNLNSAIVSLLCLGVAVVLPLIFVSTMISAPSLRSDSDFTISIIIMSCIWVLSWGSVGLWPIVRMFLKPNYPVKKVEGPVYILKEPHLDSRDNASYTYSLVMGEVNFDVGSDLADYLKQGDVYAIYYVITAKARRYQTYSTPTVRKIVSLEKLADAAPPQPFRAGRPSS